MPQRDDRGIAGWIYRGLWAELTETFRVPRTPPTLPTLAGESVETFQPAPGFLRYLKLKFWLVLALIDGAILAVWILLVLAAPLAAAVLALPLLLVAVLPDIFAYVAIHLRYDTTWFVVGARSLRIRRRIMTVTETTITFENVQNVKIKQGPLQRYYGIADLIVETAGGGSESDSETGVGAHTGLIEGVADAQRLRDLILNRVRKQIGASEHRALQRWPERYAAALAEIRDVVTGRARTVDGLSAVKMKLSSDPRRTGVEGLAGRLLRLPAQPPVLPSWAGRNPALFRPSRSYLGYELLRTALGALAAGLAVVGLAIGVAVKKHLVAWSWTGVGVMLVAGASLLAVIAGVALFTAWFQYRVTWYALGDRGLRLRRGVWIVRETTITFDNVQNVNVRQNPLERLFGIWSVRIHTAGGSAAGSGSGGGGLATLLTTVLSVMVPGLAGVSVAGGGSKGKSDGRASAIVGVPAPRVIRDHIMTRVRTSRAAGLGDEADVGDALKPSTEQLEMLARIRDEVRRARLAGGPGNRRGGNGR